VLLLGAGSAVAGTSFPTTITHDNRTSVAPDVYLDSGQVSSDKRVCVFLRLVKVIAHYPNGSTEIIELDLTSFYGAWATKGNFAGSDSAIAKVAKLSFRNRHGRRTLCEPDSVELTGDT